MNRDVPVEASTSLRSLLTGPVTSGEVIAVFPGAAYLAVDDDPGVLALVSPQAVALPNAAVVGDAEFLSALDTRTAVRVGDGAVTAGERRARPVRWWDPVPRLGAVTPAALQAGHAAVARHVPPWPDPGATAAARLHTGHAELERVLVTPARTAAPGADPDELVAASDRLVGLGAGLTPAGDDLLSGAMAALRTLGAALPDAASVRASDHLATRAASWPSRTTAVSAALLRQAALGAVAAPVARVLRALAGQVDAGPAVRGLLAAGHTSGHDLAVGLLLGARSVMCRHQVAPASPTA